MTSLYINSYFKFENLRPAAYSEHLNRDSPDGFSQPPTIIAEWASGRDRTGERRTARFEPTSGQLFHEFAGQLATRDGLDFGDTLEREVDFFVGAAYRLGVGSLGVAIGLALMDVDMGP